MVAARAADNLRALGAGWLPTSPRGRQTDLRGSRRAPPDP
uniref:Uncharacterized protein n=1 Tax=Arundo donax TaxID=35708 RepID=A0A0A9ER81_ARUDO